MSEYEKKKKKKKDCCEPCKQGMTCTAEDFSDASQVLIKCHEARYFNLDWVSQVKKMKDDFLARLVGIPSTDIIEL